MAKATKAKPHANAKPKPRAKAKAKSPAKAKANAKAPEAKPVKRVAKPAAVAPTAPVVVRVARVEPDRPGVVWTATGRARYEAERAYGEALFDADPRPIVTARLRRVVPLWKAGKAKADERGRAGIDLASQWQPGAPANVEQLAAVASLYCATSDDDVFAPLAELIVRVYGFEIAMRVLIATWSHDTSWDTKRTWLTYRPDDHQHIHDALGATPKSAFAKYLAKTYRAAGDAERAAMRAAVAAVWPTAPRHAKTSLAVATCDPARGAEIARELLANDRPHAFYAWHELPHLLTDADLVEQTMAKRDESLSYCIVANLGLAALPLFETSKAKRKHSRVRMLGMLACLASPDAARVLAEYAEQEPYAAVVREYFALHPDLLAEMLADDELRYYHDDLRKLSAP